MKKTKIILVAVVIVVIVAGFTFINNEGYLDTILNAGDNGGNDNTNTGGDNEGSSNNGVNQDGSIVGNWTFVNGTTNGQPVTHIASGWINYKADGTWTYFYDYGYTTINDQGTWQAQHWELYWGTEGSEISDWYAYDNYQLKGDNLVIISDTSEMIYRR